MVVLAYEEYQAIAYERNVARELRAAEQEAATVAERYTHDEVMCDLRAKIQAVAE